MTRRKEIVFIVLIVLALSALVFLAWVNYRYAQTNPGGVDLLPRWVGTRLLLMEGLSPYSDAVTTQIQQMFYNRPARSGEDALLFGYPLYAIFFFIPYALIADYNLARAAWMTTLQIAVILMVATSLSLTRWKPSPLMLVGLVLFVAAWYYTVAPIMSANVSVLVALLVVLALVAIRAGYDGMAGLLLALATIKPQMVIVLIVFIIVWALSQRRMVLVWSTIGCTLLLVAITSLLISDWVWQSIVQMADYLRYTAPTTPENVLMQWVPGVGRQVAHALTVGTIVLLLVEWRAAWGKDFRWMLWTACLTLVLSPLTGIPTAVENYLLMLPALVMIFAAFDDQWGLLGRALIGLAYLLLLPGMWWVFLTTAPASPPPFHVAAMFFPLPLLLLVGLYWVRWWVLRPHQPLLDRFPRSGRLFTP